MPGKNIIDGPYLGGNYWGSYDGEDINGDGLGDTKLPFTCHGNIVKGGDYLPLVKSQLFYDYTPGDVNGDGQVIGSDVTFLVSYFRGLVTPRPDQLFGPDNFWAAADVNGDCTIIGSDVTYLVKYFRGLNEIRWCPHYPPIPYTKP